MPQQDIEPSRYEFVESLMHERKGLLDSFSVEGRASDGTTGDKNGIILVQDNQIFITPRSPEALPPAFLRSTLLS